MTLLSSYIGLLLRVILLNNNNTLITCTHVVSTQPLLLFLVTDTTVTLRANYHIVIAHVRELVRHG